MTQAVLVLGSHGTIGKCLCNYLDTKGLTVVKWDLKMGQEYDLRKQGVLDNVLKTVDYVIFLAFDVGGAKYDVYNKNFMDNNMNLIINTFDSLAKANIPFIYTTSCMSNMISNPYGVLKKISEHYVNTMNGINIKLWNVYGSEEINDKSHVIPDFIESALTKNVINMKSSGDDSRQFIHSSDLAKAIYLVMNNHAHYINEKCIDVSSYQWISIYDVAKKIQTVLKKAYNKDIKVIRGVGGDNHTLKNEPRRSTLNENWKPCIELEEGITQIIKLTQRVTDNVSKCE
jgi:nucleoside-diphosphate-sugar epimerase